MSKAVSGALNYGGERRISTGSGKKRVRRDGGTLEKRETYKVVPENKPVYDLIKRTFDLLVAILCLTIGLPIYIIIAIIIMIDDPGNPIFIQERVGKNGKIFKMFKFRSMYVSADKMKGDFQDQNECKSVHFKITNDPRITRVGNVLRKTSLDELPQVINILMGDMSIVGPRPFVKEEQDLLPLDRLCVKPGLSCYWQITDTVTMSYEKQLELDYRYIRDRSIKTDIEIILRTIKIIVERKNI